MSKDLPVLCQQYIPICGLPLSSQPRLRRRRQEKQGAGGVGEPYFFLSEKLEPWLTTQGQTKKIAETLGREWAYVFPKW